MRKAKKMMEGAFLSLLILLSGVSTAYSAYMLHQMRVQVGSLSFIDIAAQSVYRANELLTRKSQYGTMLTVSIIALVLCIALFALWLLFYLRRIKRERTPEPETYTETAQVYTCPNCHRTYNIPVAFCGVCGAKMTDDD